MMMRSPGALFVLSVLVALGLQFMPLSPALSSVRPLWLAMVLGYWALYGPNVSVLGAAVLVGLASDTLYNAPLGQHVVGLALLAYTLIRLRTQLGLYAIWQVTLLLIPAWALYAGLMFVLDGMAKHPTALWGRLLPVITTALFWPLITLFLHGLRDPRARR